MNTSSKARLVLLHAKLSKVVEFRKGEYEGISNERLMLGLPISAALSAPKGQKGAAFREGIGNTIKKSVHDGLIGAGAGGLVGAGVGGLIGAKKGLAGPRAVNGALHGALLGGLGGMVVGEVRGHYGEDAGKIERKYRQMKRLDAKLKATNFVARREEDETHYMRNAALGLGGAALATGAGSLALGRYSQRKAGVVPQNDWAGLRKSAGIGFQGLKYRAGGALSAMRRRFAAPA